MNRELEIYIPERSTQKKKIQKKNFFLRFATLGGIQYNSVTVSSIYRSFRIFFFFSCIIFHSIRYLLFCLPNFYEKSLISFVQLVKCGMVQEILRRGRETEDAAECTNTTCSISLSLLPFVDIHPLNIPCIVLTLPIPHNVIQHSHILPFHSSRFILLSQPSFTIFPLNIFSHSSLPQSSQLYFHRSQSPLLTSKHYKRFYNGLIGKF